MASTIRKTVNTVNTSDGWTTSNNTDMAGSYSPSDTIMKIEGYTTADELPPCHLLDLPAELRSSIYSLVLIHDDDIHIQCAQVSRRFKLLPHDYVDNPSNIGLSPNLLATCRQVHNEATPILYGHNRYVFDCRFGKPPFLRFLKTIGDSSQYLRDIQLGTEFSKKDSQAIFVALKKIGSKLTKLSFGYYYRATFTPQQMALAIRPLTRTLDKQYKADTTTKAKPILDRLSFGAFDHTIPSRFCSYDSSRGEDEEYDEKVKDILRAMLKK